MENMEDLTFMEQLQAYKNEPNFNINNITQQNVADLDVIINEKLWNKTHDRKKYDQEYNKVYYQKRKEATETIICGICMGKFNKYTKEKHDGTKRHLYVANLKK